MKKFRRTLQSLGFFFTSFTAVLGAPDDITKENSVQDVPVSGGIDVVGEGNNFVIQGDIPEFPTSMPAVTKTLEGHFPPPKIFTPPPVTTTTYG